MHVPHNNVHQVAHSEATALSRRVGLIIIIIIITVLLLPYDIINIIIVIDAPDRAQRSHRAQQVGLVVFPR